MVLVTRVGSERTYLDDDAFKTVATSFFARFGQRKRQILTKLIHFEIHHAAGLRGAGADSTKRVHTK